MTRRPIFAILLGIALASPSSASTFLNFENTGITWSNTQLGGGIPQPNGFVELNVPSNFTGDLGVSDFVSWSDVTYGSTTPFTWSSTDLLSQSKVSFQNGVLSDVNLVYDNGGTLLTISGPPSANWAIVNSPKPPAVDFPGFPDFGAGFARGDVSLTLDGAAATLGGAPTVPPIPLPAPQDVGVVNVEGFVSLNGAGGITFPAGFPGADILNAEYSIVAGLTESVAVAPAADTQIYFRNIDVDSNGWLLTQVQGQWWPVFTRFTDGFFDPDDDGYWVFDGEPTSFSAFQDSVAASSETICSLVNNNNLGTCLTLSTSDSVSMVLAIDEGVSMSTDGLAVLNALDGLDAFGDLVSLLDGATQPWRIDAHLDGEVTYKSLPVPVLEAPIAAGSAIVPEPHGGLLTLSLLVGVSCMRRQRLRKQ